jgi:hypothetical protein
MEVPGQKPCQPAEGPTMMPRSSVSTDEASGERTLDQPSQPCHNRLMRIALATTALALGLAAPALAATQGRHFQLHVGQTRAFAAAREGDRITCTAGRHSVTVVVPRRHVAVFKQTTVTLTRRLAINLGRKTDGRVWALCRWR